MKNILVVLITGLIFLLISMACLFFPEKIQGYTIDIYRNGKGLAKINPFIKWMNTSQYILSLRIIGILSFLVFCLSLYVVLFRKY